MLDRMNAAKAKSTVPSYFSEIYDAAINADYETVEAVLASTSLDSPNQLGISALTQLAAEGKSAAIDFLVAGFEGDINSNSLIMGYAQAKNLPKLKELFATFTSSDGVFQFLINAAQGFAFGDHINDPEVVAAFPQLQNGGEEDPHFFNAAVLLGYSLSNNVGAVDAMLQANLPNTSELKDIAIFNLAVCGNVGKALELVRSKSADNNQPSLNSYKQLICGLANSNRLDELLKLHEQLPSGCLEYFFNDIGEHFALSHSLDNIKILIEMADPIQRPKLFSTALQSFVSSEFYAGAEFWQSVAKNTQERLLVFKELIDWPSRTLLDVDSMIELFGTPEDEVEELLVFECIVEHLVDYGEIATVEEMIQPLKSQVDEEMLTPQSPKRLFIMLQNLAYYYARENEIDNVHRMLNLRPDDDAFPLLMYAIADGYVANDKNFYGVVEFLMAFTDERVKLSALELLVKHFCKLITEANSNDPEANSDDPEANSDDPDANSDDPDVLRFNDLFVFLARIQDIEFKIFAGKCIVNNISNKLLEEDAAYGFVTDLIRSFLEGNHLSAVMNFYEGVDHDKKAYMREALVAELSFADNIAMLGQMLCRAADTDELEFLVKDVIEKKFYQSACFNTSEITVRSLALIPDGFIRKMIADELRGEKGNAGYDAATLCFKAANVSTVLTVAKFHFLNNDKLRNTVDNLQSPSSKRKASSLDEIQDPPKIQRLGMGGAKS